MSMKIIVAETAGFCMGVRRAVDIAVESAPSASGKIYTLGPLIHNNQTLEMLKSRGIEPLAQDQVLATGDPVLIRAHGVPPALQREYTDKGHTIIDGTCPKVKTVHKVIAKYRQLGYTIVIAGDEGHAEVVGLMGYAGDNCHLIQSSGAVDNLPILRKVCLVSQTTFDRLEFDEIAERIRTRYSGSDVVIKKTICSATDKRQEETSKIARIVDAVVIVGGKNSANTLRLANIAQRFNTNVQHVETEKEISWQPLAQCKSIGITAGASTPNWMIKRVVDHLRFLEQTQRVSLSNTLWRIFDLSANMNIFIAIGAVAMYFTSCYLQGFDYSWDGALLAFLYMLSMYLWNSLTNIDMTRHLGISRYRFYNAYKHALFAITALCNALILLISFTSKSIPLFYLMLGATLAGSLYHFTIVPKNLRRFFRYATLKDVPTSRDLFVALAWALLITFIPQAITKTFALSLATLGFFVWMFVLAYVRSLIFDLRDIEGDRIMGRETLVTIIGEKKARATVRVTLIIAAAALIAIALTAYFHIVKVTPSHALAYAFQLPVIIYTWSFMHFNQELNRQPPALFNLLADGQFYMAGLCVYLASLVMR
jgi:(E)-4-hydroxy-3-methyl-but-2-enyl pyrophosphate reductase